MNIPDKYCHNCGKKTTVASKFCPACGTSLASIDEKPPVEVAQPVNTRLQTKPTKPRVNQFMPTLVVDDDDEGIAADRVESINDLGISLAGLELDIRLDNPMKESVGNLMSQGAKMPQGYTESARSSGPSDAATVLAQIQMEAGTLRK